MDIKVGDPVYGYADGFGCVVEEDNRGFHINYKIHYQSGKDEWSDWESTKNLILQLEEILERNNAYNYP